MPIKINYSNKTDSEPSANLVLFSNEKFNINGLKKYLSNSEFSYINDLLKTSDLKKNLFVFEVNSKKKIVLISIKNNLKTSDVENLGAEFYNYIKNNSFKDLSIITESVKSKPGKDFVGRFMHGLKLKSS